MTNGSSAVSLDRYDEYGIPGTSSTGTVTNTGRFQYTGQIYIPELGMYDYKTRIYSPRLGRFLQTDPVGYEGGINIYEYALDDPVDGTDPTGLQEVPEEEESRGLLEEFLDPLGSLREEQVRQLDAKIQILKPGEWTVRAPGTPSRELVRNLQSEVAQARSELGKSERSLEQNVKEHQEKLADYLKNPEAHDNQGSLARARTPEMRQQIISGRVRALEGQIQKNQTELAKVRQKLKDTE
jgi:RHS repeat-associated protein